MSQNALLPDNVLIGTANGPGIWIAPVGTAAPVDADTALPAAWSTLGYLSEDGVSFGQSVDSESITPWQSKAPVRTIVTSRELSCEFTMLEFSAQNAALYFDQPAPVETDGEFALTVRSDVPQQMYAIVIDVKDSVSAVRYHFPRASLSEAGDLEVTASGAMGLPVTLSALDDAGVLANIFKSNTAPVAVVKAAAK